MANNFKNAVRRNISADSTLPTEIYAAPNSKKSIAIEIDVSNKSSAGVTVTIQLEDESQNVSTGNPRTVSSAATDTTGTLTTAAAHSLVVNDRVLFHSMGTAPSFTNASLPPSGDTAVSATRMYYVQSASGTSFTIAESKSAASPLTFDVNGGSVLFTTVHLADVVKDAPVPVGGALKVIAGQKLVLESTATNNNDKIYAYASATYACDVIASVLEDVS